MYREFADFGGSRISWTAPIYIFSADFADILPPDEDPMPFDGNPHPLPGHLQFHNHNWVMPEFPEIGWDELPPPEHNHEPHHQDAPHDEPHNVQQEMVDENQVVVEQSQESMVLQVSNDSVNNMPVDDFVIVQQLGAPLQPPLHIGQVLTVLGVFCLRTCCGSARFRR